MNPILSVILEDFLLEVQVVDEGGDLGHYVRREVFGDFAGNGMESFYVK